MRILLRESGDLTVVEASWVSACYDDKNDEKGISVRTDNEALFCPDIPKYEGERMVAELFRSDTADWSRTGYDFQWDDGEQEEDEENCEDEQEEDKQDFENEDYWK